MLLRNFAERYHEILSVDLKGLNLTRIEEFEDFYLKQIIDSIEPYKQSEVFQQKVAKVEKIIDVGFGGGFPLLPLANHLKEKTFVGLEARNKKCLAVNQIAEKLNLKNVKTHHQRLENIYIDEPIVMTLKAVGKVNDFLERVNTDQHVTVFFYKAKTFYNLEEEQLKKAKKNWEIIEDKQIKINNIDRYLIGFSNKNKVGNNFNNLVRLSELN